jgi:hypothetical protein
MSKRTRALILASMVAALNLAAMTAVAQAQGTNEPTGKQDARRPPTEGQVGESWRHQTSVPGRPAEPGGQLGWRVASLVFLATALALVGGLAVLAATRPSRGPQVGQAP